MSQPVCQLDDFHFTRLSVEWHEPQSEETVETEFGFDYDVAKHSEDENRYRLTFRVQMNNKGETPVGYQLMSEIVGFIQFPEETDAEKREFYVRVNGCTLLYGVLRGQIAATTGSFPQLKLVLPTFMMQDVVEEIEKKKAEARTVETDLSK